MKRVGSMLTGQTGQTETARNQPEGGMHAGKVGAVASPADQAKVAVWLSNQRPADMDEAAVSRASSHGVGLRVKYEHRFPTGENGEYLPSYRVAVFCEVEGEEDQIRDALADLRNFMVPADVRTIEGWLAVLSVIVAKRA